MTNGKWQQWIVPVMKGFCGLVFSVWLFVPSHVRWLSLAMDFVILWLVLVLLGVPQYAMGEFFGVFESPEAIEIRKPMQRFVPLGHVIWWLAFVICIFGPPSMRYGRSSCLASRPGGSW